MEESAARRVAVIIEDDPDVGELLDLVLTQSGYVTHVTRNGVDGLAAVREHDPVLTTLDVSMPGMDGFAVARRIREFSSTYLIMITALSDEIDVVMGLEAGADDYLVKPFRPRELRARAESMLRRPRSRAEAGEEGAPLEVAPAAEATPHEPTPWAVEARREFSSGNRATIGPRPEYDGSAPAAEQPAAPVPPAPELYAPQPVQQPVAQPVQQPVQQPYQPPVAPPAQQPVQQPYQQPAAPQTYQQPAAAAPIIGTTPASAMAAGNEVDILASDGWVRHNGLSLNPGTRVVLVEGRGVEMTKVEFDLLASLMSTGRRVRSKADLVLTMRGQDYVTAYFVNEADKRTVEAHLEDLRRKLGDDGALARWIEPVRGVGYRMAPAVA